MRIYELYKSTFEKVPFPQEIIEQQKTIMRDAVNDYSDDTDKEIAAMNFNGRSGVSAIKYTAFAAVLIVLLISSAVWIPLLDIRSETFHFVSLPEQSAPDRTLGLIYPEKVELSYSEFTRIEGVSIPGNLGDNYYKQSVAAIAYYDSYGNPGPIICTANYLNTEGQKIILTVSTVIVPLPLGMSEEGNERIAEIDISLAVNEFKKIHYAYFIKNGAHTLIRFESIAQREVEQILISLLS